MGGYARVTQDFMAAVLYGGVPEQISGSVQLIPEVPYGTFWRVDSGADIYTVPASPINCEIVNGKLSRNGEPYVDIFADDLGSNWSAIYTNVIMDGRPSHIYPVDFTVKPGGNTDLNHAMGFQGNPYIHLMALDNYPVTNAAPFIEPSPGPFVGSVAFKTAGYLEPGGTGTRMLCLARFHDENGVVITSSHPRSDEISQSVTSAYDASNFYRYHYMTDTSVWNIPEGMTISRFVLYPWDGNSGLAYLTSVEISGDLPYV